MYIYPEINHGRVHDLKPARDTTDQDKEHEINKKTQTIILSSHSIKKITFFIYKKGQKNDFLQRIRISELQRVIPKSS